MGAPVILVVEDTELLRRIYADKLTEEGYETVPVGDGASALAVLHSRPIDLVLLDLIMPQMGGIEVLTAMKADPRTRDIPVLILSNLGEDGDVQRGLELGAVDYLIKNDSKPVDVAARIDLLLAHMAGRAHERDSLKVLLRDREGDAERLVSRRELLRRFWCPACEVELVLELLPKPDREGWFDAHLMCPSCGKEY